MHYLIILFVSNLFIFFIWYLFLSSPDIRTKVCKNMIGARTRQFFVTNKSFPCGFAESSTARTFKFRIEEFPSNIHILFISIVRSWPRYLSIDRRVKLVGFFYLGSRSVLHRGYNISACWVHCIGLLILAWTRIVLIGVLRISQFGMNQSGILKMNGVGPELISARSRVFIGIKYSIVLYFLLYNNNYLSSQTEFTHGQVPLCQIEVTFVHVFIGRRWLVFSDQPDLITKSNTWSLALTHGGRNIIKRIASAIRYKLQYFAGGSKPFLFGKSIGGLAWRAIYLMFSDILPVVILSHWRKEVEEMYILLESII